MLPWQILDILINYPAVTVYLLKVKLMFKQSGGLSLFLSHIDCLAFEVVIPFLPYIVAQIIHPHNRPPQHNIPKSSHASSCFSQ